MEKDEAHEDKSCWKLRPGKQMDIFGFGFCLTIIRSEDSMSQH